VNKVQFKYKYVNKFTGKLVYVYEYRNKKYTIDFDEPFTLGGRTVKQQHIEYQKQIDRELDYKEPTIEEINKNKEDYKNNPNSAEKALNEFYKIIGLDD
jgi:hypothetical protein